MDQERFTFLASARTDDELSERVENRQKYMPETIEASVTELQRRGREFSAEELKYISEDIQARRINAVNSINRLSMFNSDFKYTIVDDPDAPSLYSRRVIYIFTVLMSPIFGSIMMAVNIGKTPKKQGVWLVLLFGVVFTAVMIIIGNQANVGSHGSVAIIGGIAAACCLNYFFWNRYIGSTTFYRVKMAWIPLIIALIIIAIFVALLIYGDSYNQ